jgi:hypothetical protein
MIFGVIEIFFLDLCMFSLNINELRSVGFLGEYAGSLGWFRIREHAGESMNHFEAYLFLDAFNWNH